MKAFHDDVAIKTKYLARIRHHQKADHLIRGQGWSNGKGCAVGCTLENYDHSRYPIELGIPEWLARVEDQLFEGMSEAKSRTWPEKFLEAINIGSDLEKVRVPFIVMILRSAIDSMNSCQFDEAANPDVVTAIKQSTDACFQMIEAHEKGLDLSAARSAAESAAWSARSAAESAAWSARSAAESAARSAAESAAWSAAESAARSAESAAWSARSAAWSAAFDFYADELLEMLRSCK